MFLLNSLSKYLVGVAKLLIHVLIIQLIQTIFMSLMHELCINVPKLLKKKLLATNIFSACSFFFYDIRLVNFGLTIP